MSEAEPSRQLAAATPPLQAFSSHWCCSARFSGLQLALFADPSVQWPLLTGDLLGNAWLQSRQLELSALKSACQGLVDISYIYCSQVSDMSALKAITRTELQVPASHLFPMLRSLSLRLLGIVSLAAQVCIAGGDDDTTNCPVLKGGTSLPTGVKASSCQNGKSRKFTTSVGTFATLYQSEETWQQRPEKANFTWLIREATERGLHLVADHLGGEPERLLNMHITIVDYDEPYKGFNPDADAWLETFDAGNDTQASNCHILLPFPKQNDTGDAGEWRRIQKNLVSMSRYLCGLYILITLHG